jgi:hypothetical protein
LELQRKRVRFRSGETSEITLSFGRLLPFGTGFTPYPAAEREKVAPAKRRKGRSEIPPWEAYLVPVLTYMERRFWVEADDGRKAIKNYLPCLGWEAGCEMTRWGLSCHFRFLWSMGRLHAERLGRDLPFPDEPDGSMPHQFCRVALGLGFAPTRWLRIVTGIYADTASFGDPDGHVNDPFPVSLKSLNTIQWKGAYLGFVLERRL